jgi:uncharacterized protein YfaP (DUF2135 family)
MSFVGQHLYSCRAVLFNWHDAWLVVVSGEGPNVCGHALLKAGLYYFHVDGWNRPYYMTESEYRRYMNEAGKHELFKRSIHLVNPEGAQRKLEELSAKVWYWLGVPNNCVSYVEDILTAGGANDSILSNCPRAWQ